MTRIFNWKRAPLALARAVAFKAAAKLFAGSLAAPNISDDRDGAEGHVENLKSPFPFPNRTQLES